MNYREYSNSPAWQNKRDEVIARCGGICEKCHERKVKYVSRLVSVPLGEEQIANLEGLCAKCFKAKRPALKGKREFLVIRDIAKRLNCTSVFIRNVLIKAGYLKLVQDDFYDERRYMPTNKGDDESIRHSKRGQAGRKRTYVWDFDFVKELVALSQSNQPG